MVAQNFDMDRFDRNQTIDWSNIAEDWVRLIRKAAYQGDHASIPELVSQARRALDNISEHTGRIVRPADTE
jgi:hypothetical protein